MSLAAFRDRFTLLPRPVQRIAMALLVVGLYYGLWRPIRTIFIDVVAYPMLSEAAADNPITVEKSGRVVEAFNTPRATATSRLIYKAPAGDRAYLGVVLFALLFPLRGYWLALWGYNVLVGLIALWGFNKGVQAVDWGFDVFVFAHRMMAETISLSLPPLFFLLDRSGYVDLSRSPEIPPAGESA